jgi:hypothetical protein
VSRGLKILQLLAGQSGSDEKLAIEAPRHREEMEILITGYFDNSARNKFNPDPTRAVRLGDTTYDEMMVGVIEYTVDGKSVKAATNE